jgi:hypothetical protein
MSTNILILRVLHIGFGAFWVGTDAFLTFLLLPRLRTLGPDIERRVTAALMRFLPPVLMVSSLVTFVSGIFLTGIMRGWNVNWVLANGWGTAIFVGFVCNIFALIVGFGLLPPLLMRSDKLERSFEGRQPAVAETEEFDRLRARGTMLTKLNSVLLLVVIISMAVARFV